MGALVVAGPRSGVLRLARSAPDRGGRFATRGLAGPPPGLLTRDNPRVRRGGSRGSRALLVWRGWRVAHRVGAGGALVAVGVQPGAVGRTTVRAREAAGPASRAGTRGSTARAAPIRWVHNVLWRV